MTSAERNELRQLRKENRQLNLDREIPSKRIGRISGLMLARDRRGGLRSSSCCQVEGRDPGGAAPGIGVRRPWPYPDLLGGLMQVPGDQRFL